MRKINLILGKTEEGRKLYYPFDERSDNRSILLMGRSGSGKSTAILGFERQLIRYGKKIIEVDFSDSSTAVSNGLGSCSRIIDVKRSKAFSPLARHYNVYGVPESDADFARRLADLISAANRFGARQRETLYRVIRRAGHGSESISFWDIYWELLQEEQPQAGILDRLAYLCDEKIFDTSGNSDWSEVFMHSKPIQILSLAGLPASYRMMIAELLLADLKNYLMQSGPGKLDFILVLDECQNLRLSLDIPTSFLLSQGRKYGCGVWLATQSSGYFKREELAQLYQPALILNFQPNSEECLKICRKLAKNSRECTRLVNMCEKLHRGQFIASGYFLRTDGRLSDYGHLLVQYAGNYRRKSAEELEKMFIYY